MEFKFKKEYPVKLIICMSFNEESNMCLSMKVENYKEITGFNEIYEILKTIGKKLPIVIGSAWRNIRLVYPEVAQGFTSEIYLTIYETEEGDFYLSGKSDENTIGKVLLGVIKMIVEDNKIIEELEDRLANGNIKYKTETIFSRTIH